MTQIAIPLILSIIFVAGLSTIFHKNISPVNVGLVFIGLILGWDAIEYFYKKYIKKEIKPQNITEMR